MKMFMADTLFFRALIVKALQISYYWPSIQEHTMDLV